MDNNDSDNDDDDVDYDDDDNDHLSTGHPRHESGNIDSKKTSE